MGRVGRLALSCEAAAGDGGEAASGCTPLVSDSAGSPSREIPAPITEGQQLDIIR